MAQSLPPAARLLLLWLPYVCCRRRPPRRFFWQPVLQHRWLAELAGAHLQQRRPRTMPQEGTHGAAAGAATGCLAGCCSGAATARHCLQQLLLRDLLVEAAGEVPPAVLPRYQQALRQRAPAGVPRLRWLVQQLLAVLAPSPSAVDS